MLKTWNSTKGDIVIIVRRSKTDQKGRGIKKGIPYGPNLLTLPSKGLHGLARNDKNSRAFIKTFVNGVGYEHPNITVEYTIPFDTKRQSLQMMEFCLLTEMAPSIGEISNHLIVGFKKIYELKPLLAVENLQLSKSNNFNHSFTEVNIPE